MMRTQENCDRIVRMRKYARAALLPVAVVLIIGGGLFTASSYLLGAVVGIEEGMCADVEEDPDTGERLVYCCLDEIFLIEQQGAEEEKAAFMSALQRVTAMSSDEATVFFEAPYSGFIHAQYGWKTICGPKIACERCVLGPLCGNGVLQEGEECDDNNVISGDGCSADCTQERICGNGRREPEEECDDGNKISGDGCSPSCKVEFVPTIARYCGNGVVEPGEECDDGNAVNGDGCSATCTEEAVLHPLPPDAGTGALAESGTGVIAVEPIVLPEQEETQEETSSSTPAAPEPAPASDSAQVLPCGNGIIEPPEECDDGNAFLLDGCDRQCRIEQVFSADLCGNGVLDPGEECDVRGRKDTALCSVNCTLKKQASSYCGDGVVTAGEQCDDGNTAAGDGCSPGCRIETAMSRESLLCGNARRDPGEECDDGNRTDGDGCSGACFWEYGSLGDGIVQHAIGEQCEPASSDVPCTIHGRFSLPHCGNGVLNLREECDEGSGNANVPGALCHTDCSRAGCGDSILDSGEECDDGNVVSGDGCSRTCNRERTGLTPAAMISPQEVDAVNAQLLLANRRRDLDKTGPAAFLFMAAGAAGGFGWVRRKRGN